MQYTSERRRLQLLNKPAVNKDYSTLTCYSFPEKLYLLLNNDTTGSVEWFLNGTAFRILNKRVFTDEVIPKYFKQTNFRSFTRQMNAYAFEKFANNVSRFSYFHKSFRRDNPQLLYNMVRKRDSTSGSGGACVDSNKGTSQQESPSSSIITNASASSETSTESIAFESQEQSRHRRYSEDSFLMPDAPPLPSSAIENGKKRKYFDESLTFVLYPTLVSLSILDSAFPTPSLKLMFSGKRPKVPMTFSDEEVLLLRQLLLDGETTGDESSSEQ